MFKKISIQPTLNDSPCGKPLISYLVKIGMRFYMVWIYPKQKHKFKINYMGKIDTSEVM